jgi:hypothetical protein
MPEANLLASTVPALAGASVGFLLARGWDIWVEKRQVNAIRRMLRAEQRVTLNALETWLTAVEAARNRGNTRERRAFPETFPVQSNKIWETQLPMLYKGFEQDELDRAYDFVLKRHELRSKAKKVENLPPEEQANQLEKHVREFLAKHRDNQIETSP